MRYLFLSAHTDDCELSCGGTMAKLASEGHRIECRPLTDCDNPTLYDEGLQASNILGNAFLVAVGFDYRKFYKTRFKLANYLYGLKDDYDFVFTHSTSCRHTDHRTVAEESKRIFNSCLITYIQPWNGHHEENYFVELSEEHLEKKIQALSCYKSQSHRSYMNAEFIRAQAVYNGIKCGKKYAEAFRIERLIQ